MVMARAGFGSLGLFAECVLQPLNVAISGCPV